MGMQSSQNSPNSSVKKVEVIGFGRRFLAITIDGVFVFFASLLIAFLLGMAMIVLDWWTSASDWPWRTVAIILMLVISLIYYTGKWVQSSGQTFGKFLLGIRIVTSDGSPLTTGKMMLRYLGYIVNSLFASLGFIWVAIDKKRRGWHDLIAQTYVVSVRHEYPKGDEVEFVASDVGKSWVWVVLWVLLAIGTPSALIGGVWFLGPVVTNILNNLR